MAVPRFAPSTSANAACGGTTPFAASEADEQHHRDRGMRRPGQASRDDDVDDRLGRDRAEQQA